MKFSIVIPTYNGADFVEQAILSVLNQTRQADEIIISDDNSSDETLKICQKYADKVKIYRNEDGPSGFVNGWNKAIAHACGEYISILHQDDILAPEFLAEAEKALLKYPNIKHFFVPCNYIDSEGKIISVPDYCDGKLKIYSGSEYVEAYQTIGYPHIHRCPGVITHRDIFKVCKYREEAGHIADDDFFYRVGQYTDVIGVLKPLSSYRIHEKSETGHLKHLELVSRLANDYLFQLKEWKNSNFITFKEYNYFCKNAIRFAFNEYYFAIKYKDVSKKCNSLNLITELKGLGIRVPLKYKLYIFFNNILKK